MSRTQLTITISPEAGQYVEELAVEFGLKKSAVVESAINILREQRTNELLREGYEEMAKHDQELLRETYEGEGLG